MTPDERPLRVLTVRQPWAWAIVHGGKDVENRTRNIAGTYRGPVAIHAAQTVGSSSDYRDALRLLDERAAAEYAALPFAPLGAVIGVVDLVDTHPDCTENVEGYGHTPTCSPWAMPDHHHLTLANPRPLSRPIPAKGRLGLWIPDGALQDAIWEQVDA